MRRARVVEGSCWNCRTRRVKCDLFKPTCGRCEKSGQECGYGAAPFRWVGGMALRGRHAPQATSPPLSVSPLAVTTSRTIAHNLPGQCSQVSNSEVLPNNTTTLVPVALASPVDKTALVPYFINVVLPRYCLGDFVVSLDLNVLLRDEALQGAMLAIARAHFDMQGKHGSAFARNKSRQTAIQTFRKQLASGACEDTAAQDLFSTNVLFCILDGMIEPTEEANASTMHLKGGFAILDRWSTIIPTMIAEGGIKTHLLSVFATLDLVHAILSGCKPHFEPTIFRRMANTETWWGPNLDPDDEILIASENLCRLAILGNMVHSSLQIHGLEETRQQTACFEKMLDDPLRARLQNTITTVKMDDWTAFCTLYDISAHIFYERAIRLSTINHPTVQQYTHQATLILSQHHFSGMLQHCIVLPIVIIGAHCTTVEDQNAVSSALSPTVSYLSFGCLLVLEQFLQVTWKMRILEATWWELFGPIAEKIFLF